ncbi:MAG: lipopolysaccharide biosynthesis protein, partial [bacterium]
NQVASYLTLFGMVISGSLSRHLTIALRQEDEKEISPSEYFSTSVFALQLVALPLGLLIVLVNFNLSHLFAIPQGRETAAQILFGLTLWSSLISLVMTPYILAPYVTNRFDLLNGLFLITNLGRVGLVVLFFEMGRPQIYWVGWATILATLSQAVIAIGLCKHLLPEVKVSLQHVNQKALAPLSKMSGWLLLDQLGTYFILYIDLILINRLFGPAEGGRYGAVLQWVTMIWAISGTVASVFGPLSLYAFADRDYQGLERTARLGIKLVGVLVALPISLIAGFSPPLLKIWLGENFVPLAPLLTLLVLPLGLNLPINPLFHLQTASGKVALPAAVTIFTGACNVALAYLLAVRLGWGLMGIAASRAITLSFRNLFFTLPYTSQVMKISLGRLFSPLIRVAL